MTAEPLKLRVDEDGFVCVVAPDGYEGFVDPDWTLESIFARFVEQMNRGSLFVAYPGPDNAYGALTFETAPPETAAVREVSGVVQVGEAGLWLTDYTQLTMAAQFSDESPTTKHSQRLPVAPGRHRVTLYQQAGDGRATFVLTVTPEGAGAVADQVAVPWFE